MSSKVGMITVMIVFPIYEAESGTNHSPGCAIPSHLFPARMPLLATLPDTDPGAPASSSTPKCVISPSALSEMYTGPPLITRSNWGQPVPVKTDVKGPLTLLHATDCRFLSLAQSIDSIIVIRQYLILSGLALHLPRM